MAARPDAGERRPGGRHPPARPPRAGHRCPGERVTAGLLETLATRLARLTYTLPGQDLTIPLRRIPTRPRDGVVLTGVRPPGA